MKKKKAFGISAAAIILALSMVFSCGCGGLGLVASLGCLGCIGTIALNDKNDSSESTNTQETTEDPTEKSSSSDSSDSTALEIKYTEYDSTQFNEKCEELTELASGNDFSAISNLYNELFSETEYLSENGSMLYVLYCEDPTDEYYSEQYVEYDAQLTELSDNLLTAIKAVCDGPCSSQFEDLVGSDQYEVYASYEPMTDEQMELSTRESELIDEYNTASAEGDANGTDEAELNKTLGGIYVELVQVRTKIAQSYGYDNYADYADENIYCRDFTGDEVEAFCNSVKKISSQVYSLLYTSTAGYAPYIVDNSMTEDQLLSELTKYAKQVSDYTANAADMLVNEHLYSISSDSTRLDGAYTIDFDQCKKPFIFATTSDSAMDFITLSHEFGHFTEDTVNSNPNILLYSYGSLELAEIHSNGLQAIMTQFYDDVYGDDASIMAAYNVLNLLENVTDGCLMDEFQRTIYHDPDMTLDEINKLYQDLCTEYGMETSEDDYWWMYVNHNFESPMYYISYAASGIVALEIWTYTISDPDKAVDVWEQLIEAGCYEDGYMEVLDQVGLSDFTNETSVIMTCNQAINFIKNNSFTLDY